MLAVLRAVLSAEVVTVQVVEEAQEWLPYPPSANSLRKLTSVYAYVLWWLLDWVRKVPRCEKRPMLERLPAPSEEVHVSSPLVVAGCSLEGPGGGEAGVPDG
jgi:hypothetical protein